MNRAWMVWALGCVCACTGGAPAGVAEAEMPDAGGTMALACLASCEGNATVRTLEDAAHFRRCVAIRGSIQAFGRPLAALSGSPCLTRIAGIFVAGGRGYSEEDWAEPFVAVALEFPVLESAEGMGLWATENVTGLSAPRLERVGDLHLSAPRLRDVQLPALEWISGALDVHDAEQLQALNLPQLRSATSVNIHENQALGAVLMPLLATAASGLVVVDNPALTHVNMEALRWVGGSVKVARNAALTSLDLSSLGSVGFDVDISGNAQLEWLDGVAALRDVGHSLSINANATLRGLAWLDHPISVGGDLQVTANPQLTTLRGLGGIQRVAHLQVSANAGLVSLDGLQAITRADGYCGVSGNDALKSLEGLDALVRVRGLNITDNPQLEVLGLQSVLSAQEFINISNNPLLPQCDAVAFVNRVQCGGEVVVAHNDVYSAWSDVSP